jgi:hypothetical protein
MSIKIDAFRGSETSCIDWDIVRFVTSELAERNAQAYWKPAKHAFRQAPPSIAATVPVNADRP